MTIINFDKFSQKRCTIEMQEILHLFARQKQFPTRKIFSIILLQFRELFFYTFFGELEFLDPGGVLLYNKTIHASVAELVDAQDLGSCALCIRVRVPSLAPSKKSGKREFRFPLFF